MKRGILVAIGVLAVTGFLLLFVIPTQTTKITVDLPPIGPSKPPPRAAPVNLALAADGRLTIDGAPTSLDTLAADLTKRFEGVPKDEQRVMIHADRDVPYERFMPVLTRLQEHGWAKVGLINEDIP
ncbi:MAG: ExbD/TolR family protein [Caulobacter sp.]